MLRGPGKGVVIDGPFTESKEQLLGFYVIDCADRDAAVAAARNLRRANPTAMYEIRPVLLYRPGVPFPLTEASIDGGSGQVKIDVPGFEANIKLPKVQLDAANFDIGGVKLYPGSKVTSMNIDAADP